MATTVSFWTLPDELEPLLGWFERDARVLALPLEFDAPEAAAVAASPRALLVDAAQPRVMLVLREHLPQVRVVGYPRDGRTRYGIDAVSSPVVSLRPPALREPGRLGQGVVFAYLQRVSDDGRAVVAKDEAFVAWSRKVLAFVRRQAPERRPGGRASAAAIRAAAEGLELVV